MIPNLPCVRCHGGWFRESIPVGFILLPPAKVSYISGGGTGQGGDRSRKVCGGRRRINRAEIRLHQNTGQHILDFETSEENNVAVTCGSAIDKLEVVQNHQD